MFNPLTSESLAAAEARAAEDARGSGIRTWLSGICEAERSGDGGDPLLEDGMPLPKAMAKECPKEMIGLPVGDVDKFYENQRTFVAIGNRKHIYRFSATNAVWLLSPFNPVRKTAIRVLVHPIFEIIVMVSIIVNFILMTLPENRAIEDLEFIFIVIYTIEFIIRTLARGFLLAKFTYLRDPWNWLDFAVICSGYFSMLFHGVGNISAVRMFRILRSLKYSSAFPGLKTIVSAVFESIKNLQELVVFTLFSLTMYALLGMQLYMGALRNECPPPTAAGAHGDVQDCQPGSDCQNRTCAPGTGLNPDYGYTNFDSFLWAMLASFRLMTQDFWEDLHRLILSSSGIWNTIVFALVTWVFYCIMNFILAVVLMSYEWQKKFVKQAINASDSAEHFLNGSISTTQNLNDSGNQQQPQVQVVTDTSSDDDYSQKCVRGCSWFADTFCVWHCCAPWVSFKDFCSKLIFHPVTDIIIAVLIICNAVLMAFDHHHMSDILLHVISYGSCFFVTLFAVEIYLKIIAMNPKDFFLDRWNRIDFVIVVLSVVELCMTGMSTISVCRLLGLLKIFKDCSSWPSAQLVISIIDKTSDPIINLSTIFIIILLVFAAVGMHLFGLNYEMNRHLFHKETIPRWHFADFLHGFMLVFRISCGEWIESMWDCLLASGWPTVIYFIIVIVVCRFVMANLYRAVIVSEVNDLYLSETPEMTDNNDGYDNVAFRRFSWGIGSPKSKLCSPLMVNEKVGNIANGNEQGEGGTSTANNLDNSEPANGTSCNFQEETDQKKLNSDADEDIDKFNTSFEFHSGGSRWNNLRRSCYIAAESKYFEMVVVGVTVAYSICLACEDGYLTDSTFKTVLKYLDVIFALLFLLEMIIKWMALGLKAYFKNCWCLFDFIIVLACLISLFSLLHVDGPLAFKILRSLRGLVPLKILSHILGLKVVLSALGQSFPAVFTLSLFCFFFWLVFAIMGVKLFSGRFDFCMDENWEKVDSKSVPNIDACLGDNHTWIKPIINFDNVLNGFLALFQVATFKGWIDIMHNAVDINSLSEHMYAQPEYEASIYMYSFFVLFTIIGSFFTLNLYLGVLIYGFNKQKKKAGSYVEVLMTESQKKFYTAAQKWYSKPPIRGAARPRLRIQAALYDLATNEKFDFVVKLFVGLYTCLLLLEHYQMDQTFETVLELLSSVLIAVFVIECAIKLFAHRGSYFKEGWNFFDFIVVALALVGVILKNVIGKYFVSSALIKIAGILKLGVVFRLAKGVRAMHIPSYTIVISLPALFNICLLHFVIMYAYAIFGMAFFMSMNTSDFYDKHLSFHTFFRSMIILFEISTLAGWDGVYNALISYDRCFPSEYEDDICGSSAMAIAYVVSFAIISLLITMNLFIAVIIDNYRCVRKDLKKNM